MKLWREGDHVRFRAYLPNGCFIVRLDRDGSWFDVELRVGHTTASLSVGR